MSWAGPVGYRKPGVHWHTPVEFYNLPTDIGQYLACNGDLRFKSPEPFLGQLAAQCLGRRLSRSECRIIAKQIARELEDAPHKRDPVTGAELPEFIDRVTDYIHRAAALVCQAANVPKDAAVAMFLEAQDNL